MGYESKIYIVEKSNLPLNEDIHKKFSEIIAMFDMSKIPAISSKLYNCPETNCYFYADDGNTQVLEDNYGKPLTECSLEYLAELIEAESVKDNYRRFFPILAMLESLVQHKDQWGELACLHYGY